MKESKLDHSWGAWEVTKPATEQKEGTEQRKCSRCGKTESRTVPKVGHKHNFTHFEAVPATCTESGNPEFWQCLEGENPCGRYFADKDGMVEIDRAFTILSPSGHTAGQWMTGNRKAPTCTEKGSIDSVLHCSVCNEVLASYTTALPATGHDWDAGKVDPKTGAKIFTCLTCMATKTDLPKKANPFKVKGKTAVVKYKASKWKTVTCKIKVK